MPKALIFDKTTRVFVEIQTFSSIRPANSTLDPLPNTPLQAGYEWVYTKNRVWEQQSTAGVGPATRRTRVTHGELIVLLGKLPYTKIYRAAHPHGNKVGDDDALYFFERIRNPTSKDGLIDVTDSDMTASLDSFIALNYMDATDKDRVQQGVAV